MEVGTCLNVSPFGQRLVKSTLAFYYKTDAEVQEDTELQNWIKEIFQYGFLSQETTGDSLFIILYSI